MRHPVSYLTPQTLSWKSKLYVVVPKFLVFKEHSRTCLQNPINSIEISHVYDGVVKKLLSVMNL